MDVQQTASSAWRLETETALAELDEARRKVEALHKEYALAVQDFEKRRDAYQRRIAALDIPRLTPGGPARALIREKTETGRGGKLGPRDGLVRVLQVLADRPGVEHAEIQGRTGIGDAYLRTKLMPKIAADGLALNNLGRWTLLNAGRAMLASRGGRPPAYNGDRA